jgi:hypothetical protein
MITFKSKGHDVSRFLILRFFKIIEGHFCEWGIVTDPDTGDSVITVNNTGGGLRKKLLMLEEFGKFIPLAGR